MDMTIVRRQRGLTGAQRDRLDDLHHERYNEVFADVEAEMRQRFLDEGGAGLPYKPNGAAIHAETERRLAMLVESE